MKPRLLKPVPLTAERFAPYGDVVAPEQAMEVRHINYGNTDRFHNLANLDLPKDGGKPLVSIFRSRPLPRPISIVMQACGDSNAWWNAPTLKETLCYEMAEDFVELYQSYREKPAPRKKATNQLVAENVKRIRLMRKMTMENLATDAGMPEAWMGRVERGLENCTVAQLEKLARALKVDTAAFFTQPSRKEASLEAGPRARRWQAADRERPVLPRPLAGLPANATLSDP